MKNKDIFKYIIMTGLIAFSCLFLALKTGYYETEEKNKMILTNKQIMEFEKDVSEGKQVDINNYLKDSYVDYSNSFSKKMDRASLEIEKVFNKVLKELFKRASSIVE